MSLHRRNFLKGSLLAAAGLAASPRMPAQGAPASADSKPSGAAPEGTIIDTNVHLFCWPFRHLKYGETDALVAKLRRHRVRQAWAGSFEGLLHKDIDGVNRRLAETCARHDGFFLPFGSVNPSWPDWEEDLRRCHEVHRMPGIRLHPGYQGYTLADPVFSRLLKMATERRLIVQIVVQMEDERVRHPALNAPDVDPTPLAALLRDLPAARVHLINAVEANSLPVRAGSLEPLIDCPQIKFDTAYVEGVAALQDIERGNPIYFLRKHKRMPGDRLMFASHAPYFPVEAGLFKLMESHLSETFMNGVMNANASRFLAGS